MADELLAGHRRFRTEFAADERDFLRRLASEGQRPRALFIGCSDSRVIPELLTSARPGDLFVVRNVANRVPEWNERDHGVAAAVEYAIEQLEVPDVIVCGHDGCGGVSAALDRAPRPSRSRLERWLQGLEPAVARARAVGGDRSRQLRRAVEENVLDGLAHLTTYPPVARAQAAGRIRLHGWVYDIHDAAVRVYDPTDDAFVVPGADPGT
jgi:carbonic anhydrase